MTVISDVRQGSVCNDTDTEDKGAGEEEIPDGIAGPHYSHYKGKGRTRNRSNSPTEHVSSGSVSTSTSTRGRVQTPKNVRMRDQ